LIAVWLFLSDRSHIRSRVSLNLHQEATLAQLPSFLGLHQVIATVPKSKTTLYRDIKRGEFPAPVKISQRRVAWIGEQVQAWIDARSNTGVRHE